MSDGAGFPLAEPYRSELWPILEREKIFKKREKQFHSQGVFENRRSGSTALERIDMYLTRKGRLFLVKGKKRGKKRRRPGGRCTRHARQQRVPGDLDIAVDPSSPVSNEALSLTLTGVQALAPLSLHGRKKKKRDGLPVFFFFSAENFFSSCIVEVV